MGEAARDAVEEMVLVSEALRVGVPEPVADRLPVEREAVWESVGDWSIVPDGEGEAEVEVVRVPEAERLREGVVRVTDRREGLSECDDVGLMVWIPVEEGVRLGLAVEAVPESRVPVVEAVGEWLGEAGLGVAVGEWLTERVGADAERDVVDVGLEEPEAVRVGVVVRERTRDRVGDREGVAEGGDGVRLRVPVREGVGVREDDHEGSVAEELAVALLEQVCVGFVEGLGEADALKLGVALCERERDRVLVWLRVGTLVRDLERLRLREREKVGDRAELAVAERVGLELRVQVVGVKVREAEGVPMRLSEGVCERLPEAAVADGVQEALNVGVPVAEPLTVALGAGVGVAVPVRVREGLTVEAEADGEVEAVRVRLAVGLSAEVAVGERVRVVRLELREKLVLPVPLRAAVHVLDTVSDRVKEAVRDAVEDGERDGVAE